VRSYLFESIAEPRTPYNWGLFMVLVPDGNEWSWQSKVVPSLEPVLGNFGWTPQHVIVMDIRTGEAAIFNPASGQPKVELDEHRIYTSPHFKPFLEWLYAQDIEHLWQAPGVVTELPDATFAMRGWREIGPHPVSITLHEGDVITLKFGDQLHAVICERVSSDGALIRSLSPAEAMELAAIELGGGAAVEELEHPNGQILMAASALPGSGPQAIAGQHVADPGDTTQDEAQDEAATAVIPAVPAEEPTATIPTVDKHETIA
jgi:hypothetical protein